MRPVKSSGPAARSGSSAPSRHAGDGGSDAGDRPTVVVVASNGFVVRNYLLGEFQERMRRRARVVALSPLADDRQMVLAMEERGVEVRSLQVPELDQSWRKLRMWRSALHYAHVNSETVRLKRTPLHHPSTFLRRAYHKFATWVVRLLSNRWSRAWMDQLEEERALRSEAGRWYRKLLQELEADVVFSPAPVFPEEWIPVHVARSLGIKTVLSVLSWDNLSSKGRLPVPASGVLVWGPAMRSEILNYYPGIEPESVHITGAPQFDFYMKEELRTSRDTFIRGLGGDPDRPLVVWAAVTPSLVPTEPRIVANLAGAMREGRLRGDPQLLLRLHPKDDGARWLELRKRFPEVMFSLPGEASGGDLRSWRPDTAEVRTLVNTIIHGDVHINIASTMTLDAVAADRPVINVAYDLTGEDERPAWGVAGYRFTHYRPVVDSGGVRLARTPDELLEHLDAYLRDPELDREGRRRIAEQQFGGNLGEAGRLAAEKLLELVGVEAPVQPHTEERRA